MLKVERKEGKYLPKVPPLVEFSQLKWEPKIPVHRNQDPVIQSRSAEGLLRVMMSGAYFK